MAGQEACLSLGICRVGSLLHVGHCVLCSAYPPSLMGRSLPRSAGIPPLPGPTLATFTHAGHEAPTTGRITTVSSVIITTAAQPHLCPGRTLSHSLVQPRRVVGRAARGSQAHPCLHGVWDTCSGIRVRVPSEKEGLVTPCPVPPPLL